MAHAGADNKDINTQIPKQNYDSPWGLGIIGVPGPGGPVPDAGGPYRNNILYHIFFYIRKWIEKTTTDIFNINYKRPLCHDK